MINKISCRTNPLCFLPSGKLVCYKDGSLLIYQENTILEKHELFPNWKEAFLAKSKMAQKLLRLGIRAAIALDEKVVLFSVGNTLYEYDTSTRVLSKGYSLEGRTRPLAFAEIKDVGGFEDGVVFGGYLVNMEKNPVHIYKRKSEDKWEIVYSFSQGDINHVHNIVPDRYRNCLWIFTGDFDESAAIWRVTDNFNKVEKIVCGNQQYRGCVAFAVLDGILYATDTPFSDNYIYLLEPDTMKCKKISPIDGSCIYGCLWKDKYIFSSTVEGDGRDMSLIELLFGRKRGSGIKNEYAHLYMGTLKDGFKDFYKEKKDLLPFVVQLGTFKFPYGINNSDTLYFQPMGTTKNDLCLMGYEL